MKTDSSFPSPDGLIHMSLDEGHRKAYLDLFGSMFGLGRSVGMVNATNRSRLVHESRLLFGTLDDDVGGFIQVALLRALRGRKTCGLFLRANTCLGLSLHSRIKWLVFAALKLVPGVTTVSIIPFSVMPGIAKVASDWVHDPQFWDQIDAPPHADAAAMAQIETTGAGRPVVAFIGGLSESKAFPRFATLYLRSPELREKIALVVAGRAYNSETVAYAERLAEAGAVVWQRFVTDGEIAAAYRSSAAIWVSYAPGYDQASGIFGRAVQEGCQVVVRADSNTLASYVDLLDHPAVMLSADDDEATIQLQQLAVPGGPADVAGRDDTVAVLRSWRERFRSVVASALV